MRKNSIGKCIFCQEANHWDFGRLLKKSIFIGCSKKPKSKAPGILCKERFQTVPYRCSPQQACPVFDTGKDEPACHRRGEPHRRAFFNSLLVDIILRNVLIQSHGNYKID